MWTDAAREASLEARRRKAALKNLRPSTQRQKLRSGYYGSGIVYHGTTDRFAESIKKHGLRPSRVHNYTAVLYKGALDRAVFVTSSKSDARFFANNAAAVRGGRPAVLTIALPKELQAKARVDFMYRSSGRAYYALRNVRIPPLYIKK